MPSDWSSALQLTKQLLPYGKFFMKHQAAQLFLILSVCVLKQKSCQPQLTLGELRKLFFLFFFNFCLLLVLGLENV